MPVLLVDGRDILVSIRPKSNTDPTLYVDFYRPDGKRCRWSTRTADPAEAERVYAAMIRDIEQEVRDGRSRQIPERQANPKIADLCDYYVKTHLPNKNAKPRSIQRAQQVLREFELFLAGHRIGRVQQLTRTALDAHVAELRERKPPQSAKSIQGRLILIRAMLNAALQAELIPESPIKRWLMPTAPEPEIDPLTPDQLRRVLELIRERAPHIEPVARWIALTGNRPSDALDLRWRQVDFTAGLVARTQVKTRRLATYEVSPEAIAILRTEDQRFAHTASDVVFRDRHGQPMTVNKLYHDFTRALAAKPAFERPVNLKDLRHTFAYRLVNELGCPLPTVQQLMGHRNIETTLKYVRPGNAGPYLARYSAILQPAAPATERPRMPQDDSAHPDTPPKAQKPRAGQEQPVAGAKSRPRVPTKRRPKTTE